MFLREVLSQRHSELRDQIIWNWKTTIRFDLVQMRKPRSMRINRIDVFDQSFDDKFLISSKVSLRSSSSSSSTFFNWDDFQSQLEEFESLSFSFNSFNWKWSNSTMFNLLSTRIFSFSEQDKFVQLILKKKKRKKILHKDLFCKHFVWLN